MLKLMLCGFKLSFYKGFISLAVLHLSASHIFAAVDYGCFKSMDGAIFLICGVATLVPGLRKSVGGTSEHGDIAE